jgi:Immunity protein 50
MPLPTHVQEIPGATELYDWFGYWPNFHDAEIVSLHLDRKGSSSMRVHTWEMTKALDEKGYYVLVKHVVVEFIFEGVRGLSVNGFNHQNVIFGLNIEQAESGFRVNLDGCYGIEGSIEADKISLHLTPGTPS